MVPGILDHQFCSMALTSAGNRDKFFSASIIRLISVLRSSWPVRANFFHLFSCRSSDFHRQIYITLLYSQEGTIRMSADAGTIEDGVADIDLGGGGDGYEVPLGVTKPLPRLKEALDINKFIQQGRGTFEIDTEENNHDILDLGNDEDATSFDLDETQYYLNEYFSNPSQQNEEISKSIGIDEALGQFEDLIPKMTNITEDGKVKKLVIRKGKGKMVPPDGKVFFNYIAFAEGKDEPFDSSIQRGEVEQIFMNRRQAIRGLEIGLKTMEIREVSKFWIHYDYAYGKLGAPPRIPAGAGCVFTVEMLEAINAEKLNSIHYLSHSDRANLPFQEILKGANEMKDNGSRSYDAGQYREAVKRYRKAVDYLESYPTIYSEDDLRRTDLLFTLYANIAQCYLKMNIPEKACTACRLAIKLPPHFLAYKVYYRFAQGKYELKNYEDAHSLCQKAINKAPTGKNISEIKAYLQKIKVALKEEENESKSRCRKMMGSKEQAHGQGGEEPSKNQH